jgi:apolipoprotein N-acyltransferase
MVQANLGLLEKRTQAEITHERHLAQTRELLADGEVDLVIWPETAYVRGLRGPLPISGLLIRGDIPVPLLFGGSAVQEVDGRKRTANAAFLVGPDGLIRDAYEKNLLVPLAEYVPLATVVPALTRWFPHAQEFRAATDSPPLRLGAWRIATPICYEAIRPEFVRRMVTRAAPHLLVTLANDAWFGDTAEPWMHLALASLRAVEHRRYLVRATNSGISAVVDPAGRIVARTGLLTRENLRAVVRPLDGTTVYGRLGDWPGWVSLAIVGVGLVARRAPQRAIRVASPEPRAAAEQAVG